MRCQLLKKSGWGAKRCTYEAVEGSTLCEWCQEKAARKTRNAVATALGKPSKNAEWRDPEYRAYVRTLPCILANHPDHQCGNLPGRYGVEACHWKCKGHAPDRKNLFPGCPICHDEQEGRSKAFERKYGVSLGSLCLETDSRWASLYPAGER